MSTTERGRWLHSWPRTAYRPAGHETVTIGSWPPQLKSTPGYAESCHRGVCTYPDRLMYRGRSGGPTQTAWIRARLGVKSLAERQGTFSALTRQLTSQAWKGTSYAREYVVAARCRASDISASRRRHRCRGSAKRSEERRVGKGRTSGRP